MTKTVRGAEMLLQNSRDIAR